MPCLFCQATLSSPKSICPSCGSYAEDRVFAAFFRAYAQPSAGRKVLDVAPPAPQLAHLAKFMGEGRYTAIAPIRFPEADQIKAPHRFLEMSITHLSFSDASFDVIICNRVLSYVRSDFLAMSEVHRCLRAQGMAFLNVSLEPGRTRREEGNPGLPGEHRAWSYGEDYFERLEAAGLFVLHVDLRKALAGQPEAAAVDEGAQQVVCFKFRDAMERFAEKLPK